MWKLFYLEMITRGGGGLAWVLLLLAMMIASFSAVVEASEEERPVDCDEMVQYYQVLAKHFDELSSKQNCPEDLMKAVKWFRQAKAQLANECYYDTYDVYDDV